MLTSWYNKRSKSKINWSNLKWIRKMVYVRGTITVIIILMMANRMITPTCRKKTVRGPKWKRRLRDATRWIQSWHLRSILGYLICMIWIKIKTTRSMRKNIAKRDFSSRGRMITSNWYRWRRCRGDLKILWSKRRRVKGVIITGLLWMISILRWMYRSVQGFSLSWKNLCRFRSQRGNLTKIAKASSQLKEGQRMKPVSS